MRRILSQQVLMLAGVVAFVAAVLFSVLGIVLFGPDMVPNLFAEVAGVSLEVAIVVLIVERITTTQRRREAEFAYGALSNRAAMTFVDVMRLLWIRSSAAALDYNGRRYPEFRQLAELHLAEYRSNIEGFAGSLDPVSHEALRRIDRRMSWAIGRLAAKPESAAGRLELADLVTESAGILSTFLARNGGAAYRAEAEVVEAALAETAPDPGSGEPFSTDVLFRWRLRAQEVLIREHTATRPSPPGILYDVDNDLALGYFLIDAGLLRRAPVIA